MEKIVIKIAEDYSKAPGGRHAAEGHCSGEDFRQKHLKPAFLDAKKRNKTLVVNLDGGYGYAPSFLEEAFGGLARETKDRDVLGIELISQEEPFLVEKIRNYMKDALK